MLRAIVEAAPVLTNIPVKTPAAMIRTIAGVISLTPEIISETVVSNPQPASKPPTNAPKIKLYTGDNFLIINTIDNTKPIKAAKALFITISFCNSQSAKLVFFQHISKFSGN